MSFQLTPWVKRIAVVVAVASIACGIGTTWMDLPLLELLALSPRALWGGSAVLPGVPALWQLVSWPLIAFGPFEVIFTVLGLVWFAGDLERAWGDKLFLDRLALLWLGSTCGAMILAALYAPLREASWLGPSAVLDGLVVAWGFTFRDRQIRIFFIIPVPGWVVAWLTLASTLLTPVFMGPEALEWVAPHCFAVLLGYAFGHGPLSMRRLWLKLRQRQLQRAIDRERRNSLH